MWARYHVEEQRLLYSPAWAFFPAKQRLIGPVGHSTLVPSQFDRILGLHDELFPFNHSNSFFYALQVEGLKLYVLHVDAIVFFSICSHTIPISHFQ
jgi:hypothetical protein